MEYKLCCQCKHKKPVNNFYNCKRWPDGKRYECKSCTKLSMKKRETKIRLAKKERYWKNREEILAKKKTYSELNRNEILKRQQKYAKNNPEKINALIAKRRAKKLQATPKWMTKEDFTTIEEWYQIAKDLQWLSEEPLHVDHIIPLQGKEVCGLHVPWNLQVLPASENISKGNRL